MDLHNKKILVLAPHSDDAELGCGGTIARAIRQGSVVWIACFSLAEEGSPGYSKSELKAELVASMMILGAKLQLFGYTVREFPNVRQEILHHITQLKNEFNPDIVFIPSLNDLHQDHQTIAVESMRVFKRTTVFCYELPWNNLQFSNQAFIEISEDDFDKKCSSLNCYKSQADKPYFDYGFNEGQARMRGAQCGKYYAECFEIPRLVI